MHWNLRIHDDVPSLSFQRNIKKQALSFILSPLQRSYCEINEDELSREHFICLNWMSLSSAINLASTISCLSLSALSIHDRRMIKQWFTPTIITVHWNMPNSRTFQFSEDLHLSHVFSEDWQITMAIQSDCVIRGRMHLNVFCKISLACSVLRKLSWSQVQTK